MHPISSVSDVKVTRDTPGSYTLYTAVHLHSLGLQPCSFIDHTSGATSNERTYAEYCITLRFLVLPDTLPVARASFVTKRGRGDFYTGADLFRRVGRLYAWGGGFHDVALSAGRRLFFAPRRLLEGGRKYFVTPASQP